MSIMSHQGRGRGVLGFNPPPRNFYLYIVYYIYIFSYLLANYHVPTLNPLTKYLSGYGLAHGLKPPLDACQFPRTDPSLCVYRRCLLIVWISTEVGSSGKLIVSKNSRLRGKFKIVLWLWVSYTIYYFSVLNELYNSNPTLNVYYIKHN